MTSNCFIICPIGDEGGAVRKHSDQVLRHIFTPVLDNKDYSVTRADVMPRPGMITSQIMEAIFDADLVIADLTGRRTRTSFTS